MALRIRRIEDLENAPRLENGAYNLEGAEFLQFVNLQGANLQGANLRGIEFKHVKLVGANLQGANLHGANLKYCLLRDANLLGADLTDANLSFAVMRGANLQNTNLTNANLTNANLTAANLTGAILTDANFTGAILSNVIGINTTQLQVIPPPATAPLPVPVLPPTWRQDEDCVGQEDPVSMEAIPAGRGFKLEAENRCYDAVTLAEMKRLDRPLVGPMSRIPFTNNDKRRIDEFRRANPNIRATGGKKRKTKKTRKTRKSKKVNKKQKTKHRTRK